MDSSQNRQKTDGEKYQMLLEKFSFSKLFGSNRWEAYKSYQISSQWFNES